MRSISKINGYNIVDTTKGVANGIASLNAQRKVPSNQLPIPKGVELYNTFTYPSNFADWFVDIPNYAFTVRELTTPYVLGSVAKLPNGKLLLCPTNNVAPYIIDPNTNTYEQIVTDGTSVLASSVTFNGAVYVFGTKTSEFGLYKTLDGIHYVLVKRFNYSAPYSYFLYCLTDNILIAWHSTSSSPAVYVIYVDDTSSSNLAFSSLTQVWCINNTFIYRTDTALFYSTSPEANFTQQALNQVLQIFYVNNNWYVFCGSSTPSRVYIGPSLNNLTEYTCSPGTKIVQSQGVFYSGNKHSLDGHTFVSGSVLSRTPMAVEPYQTRRYPFFIAARSTGEPGEYYPCILWKGQVKRLYNQNIGSTYRFWTELDRSSCVFRSGSGTYGYTYYYIEYPPLYDYK